MLRPILLAFVAVCILFALAAFAADVNLVSADTPGLSTTSAPSGQAVMSPDVTCQACPQSANSSGAPKTQAPYTEFVIPIYVTISR